MFKRAILSALMVSCLLLHSEFVVAQATTTGTEVACDTTVDGIKFTICVKDPVGNLTAWGNRNQRGERHGYWHYLKPDGTFDSEGRYRKDHKVGTWWVSVHEYVVYGRNERIKKREKGCRRCPVL